MVALNLESGFLKKLLDCIGYNNTSKPLGDWHSREIL